MPASSMARLARFFYDPSGAFATGTGLGNAENAARTDDLSPSAASRADLALGAAFRARTVANFATVLLVDGDLFLGAVRGFLKSDFHVVSKVRAALRLRGIGTA